MAPRTLIVSNRLPATARIEDGHVSLVPSAGGLAIGDDVTDEDLFAALPRDGLAVHVGPSESRAALRVANVKAVRSLLSPLAGEGSS